MEQMKYESKSSINDMKSKPIQIKEEQVSENYECYKCNQIFENEADLKIHSFLHIEIPEDEVDKNEIIQKFLNKSTVQENVEVHDAGNENFPVKMELTTTQNDLDTSDTTEIQCHNGEIPDMEQMKYELKSLRKDIISTALQIKNEKESEKDSFT